MRYYLMVFAMFLALHVPAYAAVVMDKNFNDESWSGFSFVGSKITMDATGGVDNTPAMRIDVDSSGGGYTAVVNLSSYDTDEFWIEFDVKISSAAWGGCKFVKFFGSSSVASQNNMSFWLTGTNGRQEEVGYYYDASCKAKWDGNDGGGCSTTHVTTGDPITMWGSGFNHYKIWVKRADSGVSNGAVKVWWNNVLRAHITNMDSNPSSNATTEFTKVHLGDYVGTDYNDHYEPWSLWYDNLYIGTTEKAQDGSASIGTISPTSSLPYTTTSTPLSVSTDSSSTCKYGTTPGVAYASMSNTFSTTGGTTHTQTISGLSSGSSTDYYIRCDNGVAVNTSDHTVNISVDETPITQYTLTVSKDGTGEGTITSVASGINCGATCSDDFDENVDVVLTATPDSSSTFTSWSGCDSVDANECTVDMAGAESVTATFTTDSSSCDADHFWLCSDGPCQSNSFYYHNGACRTTVAPTDTTGSDLSTNGTFTNVTAEFPDDWDSYTSSTVIASGGEVGLYGSNSASHIYQQFPAAGTYRYILNIHDLTDAFEVWSEDSENDFYYVEGGANRTITGIILYDGDGDYNFYLQVPTGASPSAIIDDFVLLEYAPPAPTAQTIQGAFTIR